MLDLPWWTLRWLNHTVCIRLHYLLSGAWLTRHGLSVALIWASIVYALSLVVALSIYWWSHSILLDSSEHISWVVEVIRRESKSIDICLMRHCRGSSLANIRVGWGWVARVSLLLMLRILQVSLHKLSDCWWVATWIVLISIVLANTQHRWRLRLRMALPNALTILHVTLLTMLPTEGHLLQVQVIATLSGRAFWKFAAIVASVWISLGLVRLLACHLLSILSVWRVFQVFTS